MGSYKLSKCGLLLISLLAVGCDKVCNRSVHSVATIENRTGRALTLNVCRGSNQGDYDISLQNNSSAQQISLGSQADPEIKGGRATCEGVQDETRTVGISLSPESFGSVKLCYDQGYSQFLVIEVYQMCPTGFLEQTTTGSCSTVTAQGVGI